MNVLFVAGDCPYPVNSGCRLRLFNLLKRLSTLHKITLIAPEVRGVDIEAMFDYALEQAHSVPRANRTPARVMSSLFSPRPYAVCTHSDPIMSAVVRDALATRHFDLVHCDLMSVASAIPMDISLPKVYGSHNVEAVIWERYVKEERRFWMLPLLRAQCSKVASFESEILGLFNHCVAVSEHDRSEMRLRYGAENVSVVANGVDTKFYEPLPEPLAPNLSFIGSLDWRPNQDALRWFVQSIWPRIRQALPEVSMTVVGRCPPRWLWSLCEHVGICLYADVPDVRPHLANSSLVVVPLRIGGGSRLKILEAMAAGRCVVATSVGAEGLDLREGEHLVIADDQTDFASQVVSLLRNPARRQTIARTGRAVVEAKYNWDKAAVDLERVWKSVCGRSICEQMESQVVLG